LVSLPRRRGFEIRRSRGARPCHDRVFIAWYTEALLIPGYLPDGLPPVEEWDWRWQYDGFPSIDALKDANAQQIRKQAGLTTDADELAKEGKDWREHYRQLAREQQMRDELGLRPAAAASAPPATAPPAQNPADTADGEVPAND